MISLIWRHNVTTQLTDKYVDSTVDIIIKTKAYVLNVPFMLDVIFINM